MDRRRDNISPVSGVQIVVQGCQDNIVTDQGTVTDGNPSLILKLTSGIKKYMFPNGKVFSAVCIKGREEVEAFIHRLSCQLFHQIPDFFRGMIASV